MRGGIYDRNWSCFVLSDSPTINVNIPYWDFGCVASLLVYYDLYGVERCREIVMKL